MKYPKDTLTDSNRNPAERIRLESEEIICPVEQASNLVGCSTHQMNSELERIASFSVDHNKLLPGLYYSRRDSDVITFDLRFKMHSVEHLIATLLRNSEDKDAVVYFGPMGCQTGFYFLFDNAQLSCEGAIELVKDVFNKAAAFEGEMPGKSAVECGNYINLDVEVGKAVCKYYAHVIADWTVEKLAYEN